MKLNNILYLDLDGVLADFDKAATVLCGSSPRDYEERHGIEKFWKTINSDPNFFLNLELMPDAMELYKAVKHQQPLILTGIPRDMNPYINHKRDWVRIHFGKDQRVICCQASKKWKYVYEKGDILIDDRHRYRKKWEAAGGIFITHRSAKESIKTLHYLGVI